MANNIRPYGDASLYDVYLNERKVKQFIILSIKMDKQEFLHRITEEKERKKQDELKECSFKPQLISSANPMIALNPTNYFSAGLFS